MGQEDKILNKFTPAARELLQTKPDRLILIHVHFPDQSYDNMDLCKRMLDGLKDGHVVSCGGIGPTDEAIREDYASASFVRAESVDVYATWQGAQKLAALNRVSHITLTESYSRNCERGQRGDDGEFPFKLVPFRPLQGSGLHGHELLVPERLVPACHR